MTGRAEQKRARCGLREREERERWKGGRVRSVCAQTRVQAPSTQRRAANVSCGESQSPGDAERTLCPLKARGFLVLFSDDIPSVEVPGCSYRVRGITPPATPVVTSSPKHWGGSHGLLLTAPPMALLACEMKRSTPRAQKEAICRALGRRQRRMVPGSAPHAEPGSAGQRISGPRAQVADWQFPSFLRPTSVVCLCLRV